jgi:hypothetical protein
MQPIPFLSNARLSLLAIGDAVRYYGGLILVRESNKHLGFSELGERHHLVTLKAPLHRGCAQVSNCRFYTTYPVLS